MTPINTNYESKNGFVCTCQHFRNGLQYKAKLERNYYNQNTKLAAEQRKLVDENYLVMGGEADYCTVNATAHYSYD